MATTFHGSCASKNECPALPSAQFGDFITRKEKKLLDSHLAELIPDEVYEAKMKELADEKEMLRRQVKDLDGKIGQGLFT
jgi:hypothetical protein